MLYYLLALIISAKPKNSGACISESCDLRFPGIKKRNVLK